MKRTAAIILALLFVAAALAACSVNININNPTEAESTAQTVTEAATEAATQAATEPAVGTLADYVKTGKEKSVTYGDGNTNNLRLPEILIDSADAKAANDEFNERFGEAFNSNVEYAGIYALDYEASLNGKLLSVVTTGKFEGGNTSALAYSFDVTTGKKLDNQQICDAAGKDYAQVISDLRKKTEEYYEEKFGSMPGNTAEREKTYSDDNLKQSVLYLDEDGGISALVNIYAAVGGGHWVTEIDL